MYDVLTEVQGCRGELDSHIHSLEKHVEEFREGFRSLMPLLSSTLSTQNSSIRHLLREREGKAEAAGDGCNKSFASCIEKKKEQRVSIGVKLKQPLVKRTAAVK
ncbi:hypothetical protein EYF80_059686 [Liparis tanakae]|uniref:Uncharacterized protein n=1 Tax=Liparis tanakae TaxID=230148 RepID=A0A4Z2EP63_9TELE|nr:hypothetical protein EYF80_059686 [Liparis tanakae]